MTDKKTFWLVDASGAKALVTGDDERDRFRPLGWQEATEPSDRDLVWLQHDVTEGRQLCPAAASGQWAELGWHPAAPPEPVNLTKDPVLVDQVPDPEPATEDPKPKTRTRVTGGDEKES